MFISNQTLSTKNKGKKNSKLYYGGWFIYVQKEQLGKMLDEDPSLMAKRETLAKRLDLYKSARDEIDSVAWK